MNNIVIIQPPFDCNPGCFIAMVTRTTVSTDKHRYSVIDIIEYCPFYFICLIFEVANTLILDFLIPHLKFLPFQYL